MFQHENRFIDRAVQLFTTHTLCNDGDEEESESSRHHHHKFTVFARLVFKLVSQCIVVAMVMLNTIRPVISVSFQLFCLLLVFICFEHV